jgi:hypothetical protein
MFDPQFRLSPDAASNNTTSDDSSVNGPWQQMSLDRLLEHHDITPAKPISINDASNNDYWSSSAQFNEFFNNYQRQYQQQQTQPVDISSLLSSSPSQQQQQQQQHFPLPVVDNHIFEPQPDAQPLYSGQYLSDNNQMSLRRDPYQHQQQQQRQTYPNRSRQTANIQRQQNHRAPPILQIPNDDHYHHQQQVTGPRFKQQQTPAYIACLNHGINYNGISGPPILLPPSF